MCGLINRQYVGARYVPKIMGEWNKALQYEPLSIVTYLGNSFTSKVPVPVNVDITNTDYWVNTGNYNAQVEEYRKETEKVANDLSNYKNSLKTLALYFGNSYSRGVGSSNNKGLYALTKDIYDDSRLYSGDGTGFIDYGGHANDTFITHLEDAIHDTSYDHDKVTHINIIGAWGESREIAKDGAIEGTKKIGNAIQAFMNLVKQHFPNCKEVNYAWCEIRFFYQQSLFDIVNTARTEWLVNSIMSKECEQLGMRYLGWCSWNWNFSNYYVSSDLYHPNDSGYSKIAECLKHQLQNGSITYTSSIKHTTLTDDAGNELEISYVVNPYSCVLNVIKLGLKTAGKRLTFDLAKLLDINDTIISNIAFPLNNTVYNPIVSNDDGTAFKLAPVRVNYENGKHVLVINATSLTAIGNWHYTCCMTNI